MDMSGMDMSGMDMSGMMNMYFTTKFHDYSIVFKTLKADTPAAAFGIFCVLFFCTFFLRGMNFLLFYLEQKVWKTENNNINIYIEDLVPVDASSSDKFDEQENPEPYKLSSQRNSKFPVVSTTESKVTNAKIIFDKCSTDKRSVFAQIFFLPLREIYRDIIRLTLYFVIAMFSYAIMIAAMSYIILYFFAICLGYAFGELFFNRLRIIYGVNTSTIEGACHM